mmetsp:Transcript_25392/g.60455  ORF Transcript_25392/g.60455 Transcript_25392/m.60455 type:complete len:202 (-) Transcript_25392:611-1216(-)
MEGIGNIDEHIPDDRRAFIVVGLVLDGQANPGHQLGEGAQPLQWEIHLARHDVQRQEDVLQHRCRDAYQASCKDCPVLSEEVPHMLVCPAMEQVHEGEEDADSCIYIIRPPLILDLSVDFEMLWCRSLRSQWHHAFERLTLVNGDFFAVPSRHILAVTCALSSIGIDFDALVVVLLVITSPPVLMPQKGNSKHLAQRLLLP